MTTNKPEILGYCVKRDRGRWERSNNYYLSPNPDMNYTIPLIRLSDYEALQAECEKLRRDAKRYRWLRDRIGGREHIEDEFVGHPGYSLSDLMAPEIDAAIDAAMEKESKQ